jgi:hypothetical protein
MRSGGGRSGRGAVLAGVALLLLATGCGNSGGDSGQTPQSSPTATATVESLATLFPGSSSGGQSKTVKVPASHVGEERITAVTVSVPVAASGGAARQLTLAAATITGDSDFRLYSDQCQDHTIAGAQSCPVAIAFTPVVAGERSAELSIPFSEVGGPSGQTYLVHLSGEGIAAPVTPTTVTRPTATSPKRPTATGLATAPSS